MLQVSPHKECTLRVTVLPETSAPAGGNKVKLIGVMVVEGIMGQGIRGIAGNQVNEFISRGAVAA